MPPATHRKSQELQATRCGERITPERIPNRRRSDADRREAVGRMKSTVIRLPDVDCTRILTVAKKNDALSTFFFKKVHP